MTVSPEELQLAARNHGMPLEALRWPVTPVGLHYLLIHYDIPLVDPATWRLVVGGEVEHELELTLDEVRSRPAVTQAITMECAGNGRARLDPRPISQPWLLEAVGNAEWTGTPVRGLLEEAGVEADAAEVLFSGLDRGVEGGVAQRYERGLALDEALDGALLAWAINGEPLPPQHGFPLRLLVPGWYGMASVKWLERITVLAEPWGGYQNATAYRYRASEDDPGQPVTRIEPRSLMIPPGVPDFMSRRRHLPPGPVLLEGRAWSGWGAIEGVEVSVDGGRSWVEAELSEQPSPRAWRGWWLRWDAPAGEHELCSRARDAAGRRQPVQAEWNVGGYANTSVQRVAVTVG
jgi:DMSO/TMAO reductase YedYZ molybdopterin-dependent catalytic subunit